MTIKRNLYLVLVRIAFILDGFLRKNNLNIFFDYQKIKSFKNKHIGERCFIVGTGPSLNIEILEKLKNEKTFSMNSIVLSFEKTTWRPTYYVIQDGRAFKILEKYLNNEYLKTIFVGISYRKNGIRISRLINKYIVFPLYEVFEEWNEKIGFSTDVYERIYDGYTVTYSVLQLASYMGFKEIYLLGIDCDYTSEGKKHVVEYVENKNSEKEENLMLESYKIAKRKAALYGVKIYNASRKGKLDLFDRVDLDDVIGKNKIDEVKIV